MHPVLSYLIVFIGSGIGGALRHGVNVISARSFDAALPVGTWVVNIVGSTLIGLLAGIFALRTDPGQTWRLFLVTGIVGGFTTFSAYSLDTILLLERGNLSVASLYFFTSVLGCPIATFVAMSVCRGFAP